MTMKKNNPKKAGRPEKYLKKFNRMAYNICLLGADDAQLAKIFEVNEDTINTWKVKYPLFSVSIKKGKDLADAEIAKSLFQRAKGYKHEVIKIFHSDTSGTTAIPYVERYPPDTTAAIFWLKNRQKSNWRDKHEIEHGANTSLLTSLLKQLDGKAKPIQ